MTDIYKRIVNEFAVGSEDLNNIEFVGQRIRWVDSSDEREAHISVDQNKKIEELSTMNIDDVSDNNPVTATQHTQYRSILGQINWLQSRTQFHIGYDFSRCASASAKPTIGDCKALNRLVRKVRSTPVTMRFFPLKGSLRFVGYPDAAYRNNPDHSTQRGSVVCLAEPRTTSAASARGCIIDFESHKIHRTVLSTTVAELYAFNKTFGTCLFLKGLWMDISGTPALIHMRTDANNLVTTAKTTHLPEQKETIHMIQQLRKQATSGDIDDLGHVVTQYQLADCLTKSSIKPDLIIQAAETGVLPYVDASPEFRRLLQHKAYLVHWCAHHLESCPKMLSFLGEDVSEYVQAHFSRSESLSCFLRFDPSPTFECHFTRQLMTS